MALLGTTLLRAATTRDAEQRALLLRHAKIELSADVFAHLCARFRPGFRSFHTFLVDFVCHRYWRYFEPQHFPTVDAGAIARFRGAVADAYARTDRILGRLLATLPANAIVAVVSEHGMAAEPVSAEVGAWRYVIRGSRLTELIGVEKEIVASPVARWVALRSRNGHGLPPDTAKRVRGIVVTDTGLPLFQVHEHGGDEVVVKFNLDAKVARYRDGDLETLAIRYGDRGVPFSHLSRRLGRTRSAMHDERGMLILCGEGIRRGVRLPDVRLVDVAPTLLAAAGLAGTGGSGRPRARRVRVRSPRSLSGARRVWRTAMRYVSNGVVRLCERSPTSAVDRSSLYGAVSTPQSPAGVQRYLDESGIPMVVTRAPGRSSSDDCWISSTCASRVPCYRSPCGARQRAEPDESPDDQSPSYAEREAVRRNAHSLIADVLVDTTTLAASRPSGPPAHR